MCLFEHKLLMDSAVLLKHSERSTTFAKAFAFASRIEQVLNYLYPKFLVFFCVCTDQFMLDLESTQRLFFMCSGYCSNANTTKRYLKILGRGFSSFSFSPISQLRRLQHQATSPCHSSLPSLHTPTTYA